MAASGKTPIQLYRTSTASAAPAAGDLAAGELCINTTDEKLYFKNAAGTVKLLASNSGSLGSVTSVGASGGTTGLTFSGGPVTSSGTLTLGGTLAVTNGGTGATSLTSGYLVKGNGTSAVSASVVYDNGTNVGIGTSSPSVKLDVAGSITARVGTITANLYTNYSASLTLNSGGSLPMLFQINAAEKMRIDSSGNLGLGVTTSPWVSGAKAFQVGSYLALSTQSDGAGNMLWGAYEGTTNGYKYTTGEAPCRYAQLSGAHYWYTAPSGTAGAAISFTQAMTLDASGNVGIGTSSPSYKLDIAGDAALKNNATYLYGKTTGGVATRMFGINASNDLYIGSIDAAVGSTHINAGGGASPVYIYTNGVVRGTFDASGNLLVGTAAATGKLVCAGTFSVLDSSSVGYQLSVSASNGVSTISAYQSGNQDLAFNTASSGASNEAMRISSNGSLLVGKTAANNTSLGVTIYKNGTASGRIEIVNGTAGGTAMQAFYYSDGTGIGSISGTSTTTSYNTSSDYRLKDIAGPITASGAYIDALNPVQGSWKADGSRFIGLIAHEAQAVSETQIATGEKDGEVMQAMDYSSPEIIANLIAEIQSLRARVAQLEGK